MEERPEKDTMCLVFEWWLYPNLFTLFRADKKQESTSF